MRPKDTCWDRLPVSPSPSRIGGGVHLGGQNLTDRRGGIRGTVRPGRRDLTGRGGGVGGKVRPSRRNLTGRRGGIRGTVRPSRGNLTGRRAGMRGMVLPGMRNFTDGRRRRIRSAVCRIRRGFGRDCGGLGRKVQGCRIGKARTDQLHREATNDSKQCKNRCNCPKI